MQYLVLDGETDETSCEEWPVAYKQRYKQCDNVWDEPNGQDELDCPGTTVAYIRDIAGYDDMKTTFDDHTKFIKQLCDQILQLCLNKQLYYSIEDDGCGLTMWF
ncbi:unnamed protein product [Rotaria sp. Silwood1]|nr:unnamed protein product [Rotaria sp. Silwood1]